MLKYLIIMLDSSAPSFCHYGNDVAPRLISLDDLRQGLTWAMKENLNVQFLYSRRRLAKEYQALIDTVDHVDIIPTGEVELSVREEDGNETARIIRFGKKDLNDASQRIKDTLSSNVRVNAVVTDIELFTENDFEAYGQFLAELSDFVLELFKDGRQPQLNILTDRIMLDKMNNCNAGVETLTLAPDGKFYICPAFYLAGAEDCGSPSTGVDIPNSQLFALDHAPICRTCDAYQCHRCVWLNRKTTGEVNSPSRQQCVLSHLERNASRQLLMKLRELGDFEPHHDIPEKDHLDPFEKIRR